MRRKGFGAPEPSQKEKKDPLRKKLVSFKYWFVVGVVGVLISLLVIRVLIDQQMIPDLWSILFS